MSVLIKGMEMPSIDLEWRIIRDQDGKWYAIDVNAETSDGEWHEIVPVPPHGDLIDRDKLCDDSIGGDYGSGIRVYYACTVEDAPVVIPAEPAKEEKQCTNPQLY